MVFGAEAKKADILASGFAKPPQSAAPRVWWHWMNGNITQAGIRLDLEWMKRIGIGGFHTFDASLGTPQVVEKRLVFMTPEWKEAANAANHYAFTTQAFYKADSPLLPSGLLGPVRLVRESRAH